MNTYKDEVLMHYGIKGQKKGRRRFQNEDGSLTPAGKLRYLDQSSKRNTGSYVRLKESGSGKNESPLDRAEIKDRTGGAASAAAAGAIVATKYGQNSYSGYKSDYRSEGKTKDGYNVVNMDKNGRIINTEHYKTVIDSKGRKSYQFAGHTPGHMDESGITKTYSGSGKKYDSFFEDEKSKPDVIQATVDPNSDERFTTIEGYWKDGRKRTLQYDRKTGTIIGDYEGKGFPKGSKGEAEAQKQPTSESERYRKMTEQGKKQIEAAREAEKYRKMTEQGKKQLEAENKKKERQQKATENFRRESAAKAKQRLTPEKADKVKKALAEKRVKKAVTKPNAKKNRREEIQ